MRQPVALVLELLDLAFQVVRAVREPVEQLDESLGDRDDVRGRLVVEVEELALLRGRASGAPRQAVVYHVSACGNDGSLVPIVSASDRAATVTGDGA